MSALFDLEPEFLALYEQCREESMTSIERMYALYQAVQYAIESDIPGDFVECGVWRGGSAMMMALAARLFGDASRRIWLYDTYDGMTAPGDDDVQAMSGRPAADILAENDRSVSNPFWGVASRGTVEANLARTGYGPELFTLVEGDVRETLATVRPEAIAILRLDTDWYESTRDELEALYPRLSAGGVLLVDDYGYWRGARKAVDAYFAANKPRPLLTRIDFTGRIGVKPSRAAS